MGDFAVNVGRKLLLVLECNAGRCVSVHSDGLYGRWLRRHVRKGSEVADSSCFDTAGRCVSVRADGFSEDGSVVTWGEVLKFLMGM